MADDFRHIVRVANADLDGKKVVVIALRAVKGVSNSMAHAVCSVLQMDESRRVGDLGEEETKRIEEVLKNPPQFGIPAWLYNRRKDVETGKDSHLLGNTLAFAQDTDVKMMKKMRSYKGIRHMGGLTLRGQRTRSNFRRNKGKVMGVKRTKVGKKQ